MKEKYPKLKHEDFNYFKGMNYTKGVVTFNLSSWKEFHQAVEIFNRRKDYFVWRGQRCYPEQIITENNEDWKLRSTFDRYYRNGKIKQDVILKNFKEKLKDLPNINNINIDFSRKYEIWTIGQHHGLPTPLLDWTKNPYIAAFFAFYKKKDENQTKDRVVYALNKTVKRLMIKEKNPKTNELLKRQRKIEFNFDTSHFSPKHHQRFIKQESAFTKSYKGEDIKSIVKEFWQKDHKGKKNYSKVILAEILIPDKFHYDCLDDLKSRYITHGKLFPDIAGAVEICKIDLDLDNLKGSNS